VKNEEVILFDSKAIALKTLDERIIKTIKVGKQAYGILRFNEVFYVFDVECPHAGYDLTTGKVSPYGHIVCPWHNYQFRLKGGKELEDRCKHLVIREAYLDGQQRVCFQSWY